VASLLQVKQRIKKNIILRVLENCLKKVGSESLVYPGFVLAVLGEIKLMGRVGLWGGMGTLCNLKWTKPQVFCKVTNFREFAADVVLLFSFSF
jgi:hypothetical protein